MTATGKPGGTDDAWRVLTSSGWVFVARIAAYAGSLVTLVVTARELGTSGRGALVLVVTIAALTTLACSLGLPVAGRLLLVARDHPVPLPHYLGLSVVIALAEALIAPSIAAVFLPLADVHLGLDAFFLIGVYTALNGFLFLSVAALAAFGRVAAGATWDAVGWLVQGIACTLVAVAGDPGVTTFIAVLGLSLVVPAVGSLLHMGHANLDIGFSPAPKSWRRLISLGWPSLMTDLSENAAFRLDRLILGLLVSPAAVGLYSVGATVAEILRFIPASVNQIVFYEVVRQRLTPRQLRRIRGATLGLLVLAAAIAALLAPTVIDAVLGSSFAGSVEPFRILLLAELGLALYIFDSTILISSRQVRIAAVAALFGLTMIVVTDLALIPAFGIAGAAWASVISYWAMAGAARGLLERARRRGDVKLTTEEELAAEASAPPPIEGA